MVDAGADQTVTSGSTVTLIGTPPGGVWTQVAGAAVTLSAPVTNATDTRATFTHTNSTASDVALAFRYSKNLARTWGQVRELAASGTPLIITHRGAGANLALDGAVSSLQFAKDTGLGNNMILDGGDGRMTSDSVLVVAHDEATGALFDQNINVSANTVAVVTGLNFKDFPLYRGTISTEKLPTMRAFLQKVRELGVFTVPETKIDSGAKPLADLIVELKMQHVVQVQAFASTAAQADARLGPARDAGISVGLLQNSTNNIGFPAITTCVRGGKPDLVLYSPSDTTTFPDSWLTSAINAGIALQCGPAERQVVVNTQKNRVEGLGGRVTFFVSDDPFYTAGKTMRKTASDFKTYVQHGLIKSDQSTAYTIDPVAGKLQYHDGAKLQQALLGAQSAPDIAGHWLTFEVDLTYDVLDTSTAVWCAVFFGIANDAYAHDGSTNPNGAMSCHLRISGILDVYNRTSSTAVTHVASSNGAVTTTGTNSGTVNSAMAAGQTVRVRIENYVDANGAFTDQCRFTRLDTGQWVQTAAGSAPIRGGYTHLTRSGVGGFKASFSNITATYRA